jgi:chromosome segregation ATPase
MINVKNERLLPVIETAGGARLFSLIVEDAETAKKVMDFNSS